MPKNLAYFSSLCLAQSSYKHAASETTDVVIVSDHGMDSYEGKTRLNIMEGLEDVNDLEKGVEWGNYMMLQVAEGSDPATVAASINDAMMGDVQAWASDDIPDNLQFQHKGRIWKSSRGS